MLAVVLVLLAVGLHQLAFDILTPVVELALDDGVGVDGVLEVNAAGQIQTQEDLFVEISLVPARQRARSERRQQVYNGKDSEERK